VFAPEGVVSSPLVRARQTAEILQMAWGKRPLRFSEHLATGDHEALMAEVAGYAWGRVALVGHEPHLSNLLSLLLSGSKSRVGSEFKKGGAAIIALPDGGEATAGEATLLAFLPPGVLRRMAKKS
jgi:phosphohistidine phosphatase